MVTRVIYICLKLRLYVFQAQSTFYLNSDGELNAKSLEMPVPIPPSTDVLRSAEELIEKITEETQAKAKVLEQPAKKVIGKAKATLRSVLYHS